MHKLRRGHMWWWWSRECGPRVIDSPVVVTATVATAPVSTTFPATPTAAGGAKTAATGRKTTESAEAESDTSLSRPTSSAPGER